MVLLGAAIPSCGEPPPNDPPVDPPPEPLESEEVGFGAVGRFHVGHDGSANYVIPLRVPDGRRGVQPSIALSYHSNRGDSGLGVGWAVSGASAITRCPRTAALDGRAGRAEFDDADALCLDGRRLVHVGGAPHGEAGAQYRPQREGHELITLRAPLSAPASWFEVRLPNGDLREYGFQANGNVPLIRGLRFDSDVNGRPNSLGEATRAWLINRHEDLAGNYMTYRYEHGTIWTESERAGYETHLVEIQYTGHDTVGPGQRFVRFEYAPFADGRRQDRFENGLWEYSSKRLERVSMLAPAANPLVRQYNLGYEDSGHTGRSLLTRVEECDGYGRCLPATELEYTRNQRPSVSYESADLGPTPRGWYSDLAAGDQGDQCARNFPQTYVLTDLDGSGEDDLLYFEQIAPCSGGNPLYFTRYAYYTRRNDGSGAFGPARPAGIPDEAGSGFSPPALPPLIPFDIDDDGRTDIFDRRSYEGSEGVRVIRREWEPRTGRLGTVESDVMGCAAVPVGATSPDGRTNVLDAFLVGDIDGDGGPDLMAGCADTRPSPAVNWVVRSHDPSPGAAHDTLLPPVELFHGELASASSILLDYAGLGRLQMLVAAAPAAEATHLSAGTYEPAAPPGLTFPLAATNIPVSWEGRLVYVDMNGDGLRDVLDLSGEASATIRLNSGRGLVEPIPAYLTPPGTAIPADLYVGRRAGDVRVADFNQDGREDFLLLFEGDPEEPGDSWYVLHYATGSGFIRHVYGDFAAEPLYFPPFAPPDSPTVPAFRSWNTVQIGDLNGDSEIDIVATNFARMSSLTSRDERPDLLARVRRAQPLDTAGTPLFAAVDAVRVHYAKVNDGQRIRSFPGGRPSRVLYQAPSTCEFPQRCLRRGLTVVHRHSELSATGDSVATPEDPTLNELLYAHFEYTYRGGFVDSQGQGFLGFRQREVTQWDALPEPPFRRDFMRTVWTFDLRTRAADGLIAFAGIPSALERHVVNVVDGRYHAQRLETQLEHVTPPGLNEHGGPPIVFRRPAGTRFFDYDLPERPVLLSGNPNFYLRTRTAIGYDEYSVPTRWSVSTQGGRQETRTAELARDLSANLLARYSSITTRSQAPGFAPSSLRVEYEYDPASRLLRRMIANPRDPQRSRIADFTRRSSTGLVEAIEEYTWDPDSPPGAPPARSRSGEVAYDGEQLYPASITVATDETTTLTTTVLVHAGLGVLQRLIGPSGAVTELRHDGFGRLREATVQGAESFEYHHLPPETPYDQYVLDVSGSDGRRAQLTLDAFGRIRRRRTLSDQAEVWWAQSSTFDARGLLARASISHVEGEPAAEWVLTRDDLGRLTDWREPSGSQTRFTYGSGAEGEAYDPRRWEVTTPRDHTYVRYLDAHGQTRRVVDPSGAEVAYRYGPFGRLQQVDLPSEAFREYGYDTNGLVSTIEDSRTGLETFERDGFGDVVRVLHPDRTNLDIRRDGVGRVSSRSSIDGTASFVYDVGPLGQGLLAATLAEDGTTEAYAYDAAGRLDAITRGVGGSNVVLDFAYDPATGQLASSRVSGPPGGRSGGVGLTYEYRNGHLTGVNSAELARPIWRALRIHPQGFVARESYPDTGLEVERDLDATDNELSLRSEVQDLLVALDEDGNVVRVVDGFSSAATQDFVYDDHGRLDQWSWGGTGLDTDYEYDALGNVLINETGALAYDPVTGLLANIDGMPVTHDLRGRVDGALGRSMSWRDFDLFSEVQDTATGENVRFAYTADQRRAAWQSSTGARALLMGSSYRRYEDAGVVREVFGVGGATRLVAELVSIDGGPLTPRFVHDDHLGSTAVVSSATGEAERFWRSPFGRLVDPLAGELLDASSDSDGLDPRFAGHRPDGQTPVLGDRGAGFVHMLGREYDPALGQMLAPDPMTPVAADVDGWNPYAYVLNNPATLVDPTGYSPFDVLYTGSGFLIDPGTGASFAAGDVWQAVQTAYNAFANPPYQHQQGDVRSDIYEVAGFFNGLGVPFTGFVDRRSIEDTARYEFFHTRGRMAGSAVGALGDAVLIGTGLMLLTGGEALPFLGTAVGPEGTAVGALIGAPAIAWGSGLVSVGGAALTGYHGPVLGQSIDDLGRFYNEGLPPSGGPSPRAGPSARAAGGVGGLDDLARFRGELGLAEGEGTLARLDVGGRSFYGINAHGQPVNLRVNAITRTHAEADAFQQAANAGVSGGRGTLYVDRALCPACGPNGGVRGLMRQLGLEELEVITPQGAQVFRP